MFAKTLEWGEAGESLIAKWLRSRGNTVLPVYEKILDNGKGPRLFLPEKVLIAPDLFVYKTKDAYWVEAKRKTAFSWHRISQQWVTGIDLHHYSHYCELDEQSPFPVWLLFLQEGGGAKDSPQNSPAGLFGSKLSYLRQNENHRHTNHGKGGMVYWSINSLKLLETYKNIQGLK
jgi:hypothetical protein